MILCPLLIVGWGAAGIFFLLWQSERLERDRGYQRSPELDRQVRAALDIEQALIDAARREFNPPPPLPPFNIAT